MKSDVIKGKNHLFGKFGKDHPAYKNGINLEYNRLHRWINKHFMKPEICEICGLPEYYDENHGKMQWSNKTGKLIRDRSNWQYSHRSCHIKYDKKNNIIHEGLEMTKGNEKKTVHLNDKTYRELKRKAVDENTTIKKLVDEILRKGVEKNEK